MIFAFHVAMDEILQTRFGCLGRPWMNRMGSGRFMETS